MDSIFPRHGQAGATRELGWKLKCMTGKLLQMQLSRVSVASAVLE